MLYYGLRIAKTLSAVATFNIFNWGQGSFMLLLDGCDTEMSPLNMKALENLLIFILLLKISKKGKLPQSYQILIPKEKKIFATVN